MATKGGLVARRLGRPRSELHGSGILVEGGRNEAGFPDRRVDRWSYVIPQPQICANRRSARKSWQLTYSPLTPNATAVTVSSLRNDKLQRTAGGPHRASPRPPRDLRTGGVRSPARSSPEKALPPERAGGPSNLRR
jgi:hypothetical protein